MQLFLLVRNRSAFPHLCNCVINYRSRDRFYSGHMAPGCVNIYRRHVHAATASVCRGPGHEHDGPAPLCMWSRAEGLGSTRGRGDTVLVLSLLHPFLSKEVPLNCRF